ncbi:MAG: LysR family transcriptional regulator [Myxococcota bacterium]
MVVMLSGRDLDWNRLRVFLAVAEAGSFSAAGRALGLTQPTVGRQIDALERALGLTLIERVGRGVALTPAGEAVRTEAQQMDTAAARLVLMAEGRSDRPEGRVAVTASEVVAIYLLPQVFMRIREVHPGIQLDVVASNLTQDLQRRQADIALRNFRPTESELLVRSLKESVGYFYASRDWVARHGRPKGPEDLAGADFIGFDDVPAFVGLLQGFGVPLSSENFVYTSENQVFQWEMARRGQGIAAMMREIAELDPQMVPILPEVMSVPIPVFLTCHRELKTSARIRAVYEALADGWGELMSRA